MKIVLLSGGSGKRLWPLSNDSRSKQFLKVLKNADGRLESMIQRVWGQIGEAGLQEHAYVATCKPQVEMIYSQLGSDINLIVEPERRDTFPAIALAATYLYSVEGMSLNEAVVVMPVDPFVENTFFHHLKQLEHVLDNSDADLALIGVKPTYPSEKYGYIIPKPEQGSNRAFVEVHSFREKPHKEEAAEMIREAALWNCGVFAFKLDFIINILIAYDLPIQYEEMLKRYAKLPKISFDYEVVEKANRIAAVRYDGAWKDLGTWNTLTEEIETSLIGKGIITEGSVNTHVINELDIPITLLNLSNVIVAASPDGILVADKASSPLIKDVMKHSEQRPMYEERRWGRYRVLDYVTYPDGREVLTKRIFIAAGKNLSYQYHSLRDEFWTVVSGQGEMIIDDWRFLVSAGDVLSIPKESKHSLRAGTDIEIIEVQTGTQLIEEDIVRLELDWDEIIQLCKVLE
jgi:mannose-1-phosphate guanylyltransferase